MDFPKNEIQILLACEQRPRDRVGFDILRIPNNRMFKF